MDNSWISSQQDVKKYLAARLRRVRQNVERYLEAYEGLRLSKTCPDTSKLRYRLYKDFYDIDRDLVKYIFTNTKTYDEEVEMLKGWLEMTNATEISKEIIQYSTCKKDIEGEQYAISSDVLCSKCWDDFGEWKKHRADRLYRVSGERK